MQNRVSFVDRVKYAEMDTWYEWADIFLFPSLREATGTSILEAMSYGLPVIAMDLHGARLVLDASCGTLIPVVSREQMVRDCLAAIIRLRNDPQLRSRIGEAAKSRISEHYLWERKGERMNQLYRELLGE